MLQPADAVLPKQLDEFEGYQCPSGLGASYLTFNSPAYVFVSGSHGNPWGHCLLLIDDDIGYVHAALPGKNPALFLPSEDFDRYLTSCGKVVWETKPIQFQPGQEDAARMLTNQYLTSGFNWVPWHDCVTMVDRIANAGGSAYIAKTVFPNKAVAKIRNANAGPAKEKSHFWNNKGFVRC